MSAYHPSGPGFPDDIWKPILVAIIALILILFSFSCSAQIIIQGPMDHALSGQLVDDWGATHPVKVKGRNEKWHRLQIDPGHGRHMELQWLCADSSTHLVHIYTHRPGFIRGREWHVDGCPCRGPVIRKSYIYYSFRAGTYVHAPYIPDYDKNYLEIYRVILPKHE